MLPFAFPPMVLAALGAMGGVALARALVREWHRVNDELERMARSTPVDPAMLPKLRRDPRTGVYRPE